MKLKLCRYCSRKATRAICGAGGPWVPVCNDHVYQDTIGNVPISQLDAVNRFVPKMFGGTFKESA